MQLYTLPFPQSMIISLTLFLLRRPTSGTRSGRLQIFLQESFDFVAPNGV